ncbi:MAG: hypothetical protein OHK0040_00670 [bacterium]
MVSISLPEQKNYQISKERALKELEHYDAQALSIKTGASLANNHLSFNFFIWQIEYFPSTKQLFVPQNILSKSTEGLILHYLAYCRGVKPKNEWINFYQIKDASLYLPVFNKRTINIIQYKVKTLEQFVEKCIKLGGEEMDFTSSARAFRFYAFPYVPLLLVYYEGDEDIPSELKFMFDSSVTFNLSAEDVVVAAQFLSLQFLKV